MINYTKAFDYLLQEAKDCSFFDTPEFRAGGKYKLSKWVDKDLASRLNQFHAEPFKDSLKLDFAMTFSSYLELKAKGRKASFPGSYADSEGNLTSLRPIFFCRYDIKRDYCLLYDREKARFFIKLYLLNQKSARSVPADSKKESKLEHVHKTGQKLIHTASRARYIILPLSFGTWQEQYLKQSLENPEILKTARLLQRNGDFFITINLNLPEKEPVKTETFLGISRGPENSFSITVTDQQGEVRSTELIGLQEVKNSQNHTYSMELYPVVKRIVAAARENKSQVILENLSEYQDGIHEVDFDCGKNRNIIKKSVYQSMERILNYKLEAEGLPQPVKVSPLGIFSTCPKCGLNTKKSRLSKGMFLCVSCGAAYHIRSLGSLNLANRLIKYNTDDIRIKVVKEESGFKLSNEILGLEICVPNTEDVYDNLSREISDIIRSAKENRSVVINRKDYRRKWSMIQKIESFDDFTKHITFV